MTWTVQLSLRAPSLLADAAVPLVVTLRNAGAAAEAVPQVEGSAPLEYTIRPADGEAPPRVVSRVRRQQDELALSVTPPRQDDDLVVAAGEEARFEEDLAWLLGEPLAPGRYTVEATYHAPAGRRFTSRRAPLTITVSRPRALAQALAVGEGRVVIAEWHEEDGGATRLRLRHSGGRPLGGFADLATLAAAESPGQVAVSTHAGRGLLDEWRWLAWTRGADVRVAAALGEGLMYPGGPIASGLAEPSLLPLGYTVRGGGAVFVVAGRHEARARVRVLSVAPGRDVAPRWTDVRLATPDGAPEATCVWSADGPPELALCWLTRADGVASIVAGRVDAATGEVVAPATTVFTTRRAVLAFAAPPTVGPGERRSAQVLLAPPREDAARFTRVTFDVVDPSRTATHELPRLPAFAARGVDRWVLPSEPHPGAPVLAVGAGEIWAASDAGWTRIADGDIEPASARLWAFAAGRLLCTWFDRTRGYRWQRLAP